MPDTTCALPSIVISRDEHTDCHTDLDNHGRLYAWGRQHCKLTTEKHICRSHTTDWSSNNQPISDNKLSEVEVSCMHTEENTTARTTLTTASTSSPEVALPDTDTVVHPTGTVSPVRVVHMHAGVSGPEVLDLTGSWEPASETVAQGKSTVRSQDAVSSVGTASGDSHTTAYASSPQLNAQHSEAITFTTNPDVGGSLPSFMGADTPVLAAPTNHTTQRIECRCAQNSAFGISAYLFVRFGMQKL